MPTTVPLGRVANGVFQPAKISRATEIELHQRYATTQFMHLQDRGVLSMDDDGYVLVALRPPAVWWTDAEGTHSVELPLDAKIEPWTEVEAA